ncbi:UNVERIFIED_CONTAM: hypothetical protein NCL1_45139 [Trichonephila clavipes]
MDRAILIPSLNATAFGVTDATKPAVRGSVGKYATRTAHIFSNRTLMKSEILIRTLSIKHFAGSKYGIEL